MGFTPFERQPDERSAIMLFVDSQRDALLAKLDGLTDEQVTSTPSASGLSLFGIVKHCAHVERRWVLHGIGGLERPEFWPPTDRDHEFRADDGQTIESLRRFYADIARENRAVIDAISDLGAPGDRGLDPRWILLHMIEELARHAGQADVIRESIDGTTEED